MPPLVAGMVGWRTVVKYLGLLPLAVSGILKAVQRLMSYQQMSSNLTKPFPRLWNIDSGIVMVVTDLHGDWDAYQRYRDHFIELQAKGKADYLVFTGDLIHAEPTDVSDHSLEIVLDVLELQAQFGTAIIYLCGNHELPHIYGFGLSKGTTEYTPGFEARLSQNLKREVVINLFNSLPFYIRTAAGISLAHAGASAVVTDLETAVKLFNWDHRRELARAEAILAKEDVIALQRAYAKLSQATSYEELARHYLAVAGPTDSRYNDLLRGAFVGFNPDYDILHSALFTKCEQEYGIVEYSGALEKMLEYLSTDYVPQKVLVAGHMTISNGYQVIANKHFRMASGVHATPREAGVCLFFNAEKGVKDITELQGHLHSPKSRITTKM